MKRLVVERISLLPPASEDMRGWMKRAEKALAKELAAVLGVAPDSPPVAAVITARRRFVAHEAAIEAQIRGDHRSRDIEALKALAEALDGLTSNSLARLVRCGQELSVEQAQAYRDAALLAEDQLRREQVAAKVGRKPMVARDKLLSSLAEAYRESGCRRKLRQFIEVATKGLGPLAPDHNSLTKAVQRARRNAT